MALGDSRSQRGPGRRRGSLDVHLRDEVDVGRELLAHGRVNRLLALHRSLHHVVVRLERLDVLVLALEGRLRVGQRLDALREAVLGDQGDDLAAVLLLGVRPARRLVEGLRVHAGGEDLVDLRDRLGDGRARLLELGDQLRVVEDAAGHLTMPAAQAQHQVQGRLLLDVVVRERAAVLKLLASEDQALLVRRDALLVLDLGLDVLDRVGRLDLEGDRLAGDC